jgi:cell division septum initiation protein DivIVA
MLRTLRERRDQYLALLERQLGRLQLENARLASQVSDLQQKLDVHGDTACKSHAGSGSDLHSTQSQVSVRSKAGRRSRATTIRLEKVDGKPQTLQVESPDSGRTTAAYTYFSSPLWGARNTHEAALTCSSGPEHPAHLVMHLDLLAVATDFVLK